ncbi:MAG TPA: class I SAM-dependent methyltransferase [Allosphingosinicella sp.]|jgi:ubiquinone/menaquinone biosynthesis C-methylase UbiE
MKPHCDYLLADSAAEVERLRLQSAVWEPATEAWLKTLHIQKGAKALDLGCGAIGALPVLSRLVGPGGSITGADLDPMQVECARRHARQRGLRNVSVVQADAFATGLPEETFDAVHIRFLIAPTGRGDELVAEALRLLKPGGLLLVQEPHSDSWSYSPEPPEWPLLKSAILAAFRTAGGDFDAGAGVAELLRRHGVKEVRSEAVALDLEAGHPYLQLPVQFAMSLRPRLVPDILSENVLARCCERIVSAAAGGMTGRSFTVVQSAGRKCASGGKWV